jgi:hypothetical protein
MLSLSCASGIAGMPLRCVSAGGQPPSVQQLTHQLADLRAEAAGTKHTEQADGGRAAAAAVSSSGVAIFHQ